MYASRRPIRNHHFVLTHGTVCYLTGDVVSGDRRSVFRRVHSSLTQETHRQEYPYALTGVGLRDPSTLIVVTVPHRRYSRDGQGALWNCSPRSRCRARLCPGRSVVSVCETRTLRPSGSRAISSCASGGISRCLRRLSPARSCAPKWLQNRLVHNSRPHLLRLTFPVVAILWIEEVMADLVPRDALDNVHRLQRVDDHAVHFLLPSEHPHLAVFGEQLPPGAALAHTQAGHGHLLLHHSVDLKNPQLKLADSLDVFYFWP
jgi:hypothetical protein